MNYTLDTNILIYWMQRAPATLEDRVNALATSDSLCMSFVSYAELLKGVVGSQRKALVLKQLDALICEIPVLFDASTAMCEHYAEHSMRLKAAGTPIGGNDLWIACHALAEGATIVTNNTREFARVAGLALENWA